MFHEAASWPATAGARQWLRGIRPTGLSLRRRILVHQAVVTLLVLAGIAVTFVSIDRLHHYAQRDRLAGQQLGTVLRLSADMNRYSENIAEVLLLGRTELDDLEEARRGLEAGLNRLLDLVEIEVDLVDAEAEADEARGSEERDRARRMEALYEEIDVTALRLLFLRDQGQQAEAVALFREAIEESLDGDLELEIQAAIADESAELAALQVEIDRLRTRLIALLVGLSLGAILVSTVSGARLARSLGRPIRSMISGTRAVGDGDLGHRIDEDQPAEFADLARQFNRTAGQLAAQRDRLLAVQAGLEDAVATRTAELEDANARLQRLDQLRMLFLADIGHELRTPLTILRGEAEVALRGDRPAEDHRETLGRVVQITHQMGRLVEDLLFLARAEVGAVRFEMQPIAVQDVLEIALMDARVLAEAGGVKVAARVPADPMTIEGDAGRLTQALVIVLDNAVKYSDPGAPVEVALTRQGGEARLVVANRGPGIPKADLPLVFNRFYRGRQDGARREGSGLGLPIAKWIVETHGGQLGIESEDGVTRATFRLPLRG